MHTNLINIGDKLTGTKKLHIISVSMECKVQYKPTSIKEEVQRIILYQGSLVNIRDNLCICQCIDHCFIVSPDFQNATSLTYWSLPSKQLTTKLTTDVLVKTFEPPFKKEQVFFKIYL